jgi:chromosome partitioning protein
MAKVIAVTLRKGGSGKTTTSVNLATALQLKGKRTLLVDLDPQANATISVGIDPMTLPYHINTLFTDINTKTHEAIVKTSFNLDILPSHPNLAETEAGMRATQIGLLKGLLEPVKDSYDYIVIDTPPAESYLTVNAMAVADEIIIPLQAHYLAMRGLQDILDEVEQVKHGLNPNLKIAGILPTMVHNRTNIAKTVLEAVTEAYKGLLYPLQVEFSIKHAEATLAGLPIVIYDPQHQGSIVYMQLADTVMRGGENGE